MTLYSKYQRMHAGRILTDNLRKACIKDVFLFAIYNKRFIDKFLISVNALTF